MPATARDIESERCRDGAARFKLRRITPNLRACERKVYSQFGEDGVIEQLADDLGIRRGTFFEFGIGPSDGVSFETMPLEGNFALLRERGWNGVFLDGHPAIPPSVGIHREFVTPLNINQLYRKYDLPEDLDFMSIDVDGQDFWIWMALSFRPKVVIVEYNAPLGPDRSVTVGFDVAFDWDGSNYVGASLRAFYKLAQDKRYTLVYTNGVNAIFVLSEIIENKSDFNYQELFVPWPVGWLPHREDERMRAWTEI